MKFGVITLFPEMFTALTDQGVVGKAFSDQLSIQFFNPRDFTGDKYRTVDDRPFGGGPGMLMMAEPLARAVEAAKLELPTAKVVFMSPQGEVFNQKKAEALSKTESVILVCGRYEGIDQRFIDTFIDMELSIGDFVLSGGEVPAMAVMDAVARLMPGVLGHADSAVQDSFNNGRLDHPHYTRPEEWRGQKVPDVLLSGHHKNIEKWRAEKALEATQKRRPDLL